MGRNEKFNVARETLGWINRNTPRCLMFAALCIVMLPIGLAGFSGCAKPTKDSHDLSGVEALQSKTKTDFDTTLTPPPFRQEAFSLQKRHGLGGWSGPKRPSEQELLLRMKPKAQLSQNIQASRDKHSTEASLQKEKTREKPHKTHVEKHIKTHEPY